MASPLEHHQNVWKCLEPNCGIHIPILDGFGSAIAKYHRQEHVVDHLAEALTAERVRTVQLTHDLAAAEQLNLEQRQINGQLSTTLNALLTGHALAGRDEVEVTIT